MRKFTTKWSPTGDRYAVPAEDVHEWAAEDDGPEYVLVPGVGFVPPFPVLVVTRDGDTGPAATWQGHGQPYGDLTTVDN